MALIAQAVYQKLVRDIGIIYEEARRALITAWWRIGERIVEVEQKGEAKAPHGSGLLQDLSRDLTRLHGRGFSYTNLKNMRRLYLENSNRQPAGDLSVTHQIELLSVRDSKKRRLLERRVLKEGLNRDEVRALVQAEGSNGKRQLKPVPPSKLLTPIRGKLYTHKIVEKAGALYVDLGFRNHRRLTPAQAAHFRKDDIVEMLPDEGIRKLPEGTAKDLYTYEVELERIHDGDTQWYFIFTDRREARGMRNDKLRLRGIDCPELRKAAGRAARQFVEKMFERTVKVTVTTTKPDMFDRYLSDIFLRMKDGAEVFLNNELLKRGHARLYGTPKPEDWDD